jgi:hypothetical protein
VLCGSFARTRNTNSVKVKQGVTTWLVLQE